MSAHIFDPKDLFPLLEEGLLTYAEEQDYSKAVDQYLGFRIPEVEHKIAERFRSLKLTDQNFWIGLAPEVLQTPYPELRRILCLADPTPGQIIADLGAAYGRLGLIVAKHYPECFFRGYEAVLERVEEAQRVFSLIDTQNVQIRQSDLKTEDCVLQHASIYFLYDFGSRQAIEKVLRELKDHAKEQRIKVVGRGRAVRDAIERQHPWLSAVIPPQHFSHFSLYQSA